MSRADLHLVADPDPERSLGDAIAWAYSGDATQNGDDDYGDTDTERYQQRVRVLRDQLRAEQTKGAQ